MSVLEVSFIIYRLNPYYRNFNKRLTKAPKLYFYDTGLLCHLLGMRSEDDVFNYFQLGALFENLIVADKRKRMLHEGEEARLYFYRDSNHTEVDLVEETGSALKLTEINSSRTFKERMTSNLHKLAKISDRPAQMRLVFGGDESFDSNGVSVLLWHSTW